LQPREKRSDTVTDAKTEPNASPVLRMGVAVFFLGCAALAIAFAWREFERSEAVRLEKQKQEEASTKMTTKTDGIEKMP
jgi:hypothetical protein